MTRSRKKYLKFIYRWLSPFADPLLLIYSLPRYFRFFNDWRKYSKMEGAEFIRVLDTFPRLHERTKTTHFDKHYFYQDIWAFKRILKDRPKNHVDVGSRVDFVGFLSAITKVKFVDLRPIEVNLENFESIKGDILALPFGDSSIESLSCLHVAEHIGLGRYGDSLNPLGTKRACKELARVLARGGNLYFSLPVGRPKLCFNAHRILAPQQIIDYFSDLKLIELSGVDDKGNFMRNIDINILKGSDYACGLFWFKKM